MLRFSWLLIFSLFTLESIAQILPPTVTKRQSVPYLTDLFASINPQCERTCTLFLDALAECVATGGINEKILGCVCSLETLNVIEDCAECMSSETNLAPIEGFDGFVQQCKRMGLGFADESRPESTIVVTDRPPPRGTATTTTRILLTPIGSRGNPTRGTIVSESFEQPATLGSQTRSIATSSILTAMGAIATRSTSIPPSSASTTSVAPVPVATIRNGAGRMSMGWMMLLGFGGAVFL